MGSISSAAKEAFSRLTAEEKAALQEEASRRTLLLEGGEVPLNSAEAVWARDQLLRQLSDVVASLGKPSIF